MRATARGSDELALKLDQLDLTAEALHLPPRQPLLGGGGGGGGGHVMHDF